jgi:hypothetical protein
MECWVVLSTEFKASESLICTGGVGYQMFTLGFIHYKVQNLYVIVQALSMSLNELK